MSLINATVNESEVTSNPDVSYEHQNQDTADWYIDEGVPGVGPRPDWLDTKFKHMKAAMNSLKELERKMGSSNIPESYDFSQFEDVFDKESPIIGELTSKAKSHRLSQETFTDLMGEVAKYNKSLMPDIDAEMAKLGDNPQARLDVVNNWVSNNLSQKAADTLGKISYTAEVVEMMDEMRQKFVSLSSRVPLGSQGDEKTKVLTRKEVEAEMEANFDKYQKDSRYRDEIQAKFHQVVGD